MNIKIVIATHKKYRMPEDKMYVPLQVGRAIHDGIGYMGDNTGENISGKNPNYCELTAMYWAWKNLDGDFLGLVHYRRHFCDRSFFFGPINAKWKHILSSGTAQRLLAHSDVIMPKKRHYWIETSMSHYVHAHNGNDLRRTRNIIKKMYPEYVTAFDQAMLQTASHRFNMFIMKRTLFDAYADWLFSILFQLEKEIDISRYSPKEARVFGYISERLLDVWLDKNNVNYIELPVLFMERQNWFKKIFAFFRRKFA
ncbi:DUF4422 domain-containing protein [Sporolactobacillus putidus]|uniref:Exopolysaccharide biosynthesis protein n=1 Tax=Sporolactobacillus putidus TaxID=492735 RepID=A0A917W1F9_9BACL|nr:DUF4422 domain-containing protein [Sporolactobacillus putidus]GGL50602.1 exopolysaccharide biosynthesis protein [Sporolactobacillus putidus]